MVSRSPLLIRLITSTQDMKEVRKSLVGKVGFVPTMGNLHEGHLSLARGALEENDHLIFSIFVNPKQFGPKEDFAQYPRTLEDDLAKIQTIKSKTEIIVFSPASAAEIYPEDMKREISVTGISSLLEGDKRPTHFAGVTTVVLRLFELALPNTSYFGLKDYQQYLIIKKMTEDLCLPIKIVGMPIVREDSGLALSSRNQYLSPEEKAEGLILFKTLKSLKEVLKHDKNKILEAKKLIENTLKDPRWDYLEIRDAETLSEDLSQSKHLTILGVLKIGTVRLLDNLQVELE